ncbi:MAG TPA: flagellar motor switch protein FliG [Terriglobia bacterium]|nr:flagellar motor switch protein FliG [Terriglobia bacterium]
MAVRSQEKISGLQKAAMLMVMLGDKAAASIYRQLPQEEVEELTREIARIGVVSPDVGNQILDEFNKLTLAHEYVDKGGADYAHKLLVGAFGESTAKDLLQQVLRTEAISFKDLELVQRADPQQLAKLIEGEHPQTIALLLAHLGARTASTLLRMLPEPLTGQVVERLAKLRPFSPEMVQRIVSVLNKKIQSLGKQDRLACGGVEAVADLLNRIEAPITKSILQAIEQGDAELAVAIRNQMFTFDDFAVVPEASIREVVAQVDKKTLALALKGATAELKNHFLKVMSSRAAEMLNEDIDVLGQVRGREVAHAQQEVVQTARKLETEGKIYLKNEGDETYV